MATTLKDVITLNKLGVFKQEADKNYVAQEDGKGLSTNDYDASEKAKVAGALQASELDAKVGQAGYLKETALNDYAKTNDVDSTYVKKDGTKVLSDNNFDDAAKAITDKADATYATKAELPTDYLTEEELAEYAKTSDIEDGYVAKEANKGLSTNDYDNTAKGIVDGVTANLNNKVDKADGKDLIETVKVTKLDGIADGAQVNVIESISVNGTDAQISAKKATVTLDIPSIEGLAKSSDVESNYVKKDGSKVLSDNNYTTEDKTKLGTALQPSDLTGYATEAKVDEKINAAHVQVIELGENVADITALNQITPSKKEIRWVEDPGMFYMWTGSKWEAIDIPLDGLVSDESLSTTLADYAKTTDLPVLQEADDQDIKNLFSK